MHELRGVGDCKIFALPRNRVTDEEFERTIRPVLDAAGVKIPRASISLSPSIQPLGGADAPADQGILVP